MDNPPPLVYNSAVIDHQFDAESGILTVRPEAPLTRDDFEVLRAQVDPYIEAAGRLRGLLIEAATFPGWADLEGLMSHFRFVRDHHRRVDRVAVVSDDVIASALPALSRHFVKAQVRHFSLAQRADAIGWLDEAHHV